MKMIEAVIKPERLDHVKAALNSVGVKGATAVDARGFGTQLGHTEQYRGATIEINLVHKVLLKVCVKDADVQAAVDAIIENARTGDVGDGKIFVYPVSEVVRIRTGERDEAAL